MLESGELTEKIIGAAIEVHRRLGVGFLETFYEAALCIELRKRGLPFLRQPSISVYYDGQNIGRHRLDLMVGGEIVVELKAVRALKEIHFYIVRSYLKAAGKKHGLLLNFAVIPLEIKRVISP